MDLGHLNNLFTYESSLTGRRVRVCRLLPGSRENQLSFVLSEENLDGDAFAFTALSYMWGNPDDTKLAICNGKAIRITNTLYAALQQMREKGYTGNIWADAICINQRNMQEKMEQVRMMGDIYKRAEAVFIWLGEGKEDDFLGIFLMALICKVLKEEGPDISKGDVPTIIEPSGLGLTQIPQKLWSAMISILQRRWFWRAWVIQEYHRAKKRVFQCGSLEIDEAVLFGICRRISNHHNLRDFIVTTTAASQEELSKSTHCVLGPFFAFCGIKPGQDSLATLLSRAGGLQSSDRRDRIFALVGLSSDTSVDIVDYHSDIEDVFRRIAEKEIRRFLASPNPSDVFVFLCMVHNSESREGYSSWAPTFELSPSFQPLSVIFRMEAPFKSAPQVVFTESKILQITGRIFDRVREIRRVQLFTTSLPPVGRQDHHALAAQSRKIIAAFAEILDFVLSLLKYPDGENLHEVAWRSLLYNTVPKGERAPPSMAESFLSYRESHAIMTILVDYKISGKYSYTTPNEILQKLQDLVPGHRWRPSSVVLDATNPSHIWDEMGGYLVLTADSQNKWLLAQTSFTWDRDFFASKIGYVGWVPCHAMEGDLICAFYGSRYPFVLRPHKGMFRLIGACYMHGIMEGEAIELPSIHGSGDITIGLI